MLLRTVTPKHSLQRLLGVAMTTTEGSRGRAAERAGVLAPEGSRPRVLVVCRMYGIASEIWIQRQLAQFSRFDVSILCWKNLLDAPTASGPSIYSLDADFERWEKSPGRWLRRLASLPDRNLCGASGAERAQLVRLVRKIAPDVILCHFGATALRLLPVAEALEVPLVAHFHGYDISSSLRHNRYYRWSLRRCVHRFAECIVVGSHQYKILRELGVPAAQVSLIPCGAPADQFVPLHDHSAGRCRFITVSRLVSWKGVDYSLRAFARIHATHPETELHIVGDGPEEQALRQLSRALGVAHAVTFHGRQAPESVRDLMGRCDVFLQHSLDHESGWTEGFGVSITEASASGLPVIVTNSGGIPDQVTEDFNGHLAPQRDVEAFARLMSALATDPARRRRLGQAGRARACQEFDAAKMAQRLEQRLLAAVHRRRPDASMASPMLSPVRASLA